MKLVITIDTEEDNWGNYDPREFSLQNIDRLSDLQSVFDEYSVRPTYLITYPVATANRSVEILSGLLRGGRCEIGAHCHPWNTPPYEEELNERNSMLCNLPPQLQYEKLESLHNSIKQNFGIEAASFRAGRWGFSEDVGKSLALLGYKVDTSVTPYTDWRIYSGVNYSHDSPRPYKLTWEHTSRMQGTLDLIELPASVGYLQSSFAVCNRFDQLLRKKPVDKLRLLGLLHKLGLLNRVGLSPELADSKNMIRLAKRLMKNNYPIINMFFHSPSLQSGLTPFVKTADEEKQFVQTIREFLKYVNEFGIESITLSESPLYLNDIVTSYRTITTQ